MGRERIYNYKFSEVNDLRKGRLGDYSQKEICLKFSQTEGNIKAILVTIILMFCAFCSLGDHHVMLAMVVKGRS